MSAKLPRLAYRPGRRTPVHDPEVGLEVGRIPVASLRLADVVGNGRDAVEVGNRAWLDVEPLERPAGKRQDNACLARREDVNGIGTGAPARTRSGRYPRDRLGRRSRPMIIIIIISECA